MSNFSSIVEGMPRSEVEARLGQPVRKLIDELGYVEVGYIKLPDENISESYKGSPEFEGGIEVLYVDGKVFHASVNPHYVDVVLMNDYATTQYTDSQVGESTRRELLWSSQLLRCQNDAEQSVPPKSDRAGG